MKIILFMCDLLFAGLFGAGVASLARSRDLEGLMFFIVPTVVVTLALAPYLME